ncbi:toll/interleukin-1 receptor domain-containing protein [Citrobacter braakii]|uniref:toll/interleukin-1 receptor domain-containing protein n=1 Tax=Citrobacter braakii TaxID=57706 RepID=UPI0039B604E7
MTPTVFISYSHDNELHKNWVLQLATRLRSNGVDVLLDRWNLKLGQDLAAFMERGLSSSHRVLCICSETYVAKANDGKGGVGYEKQIITGELLADLNTNWVIPVIRNNPQLKKVPRFLVGRMYVSFEDDKLYESRYEEVLRELLDEPLLPIPPLGPNPFNTVKIYAEQKFFPASERYVSPTPKGRVNFDYSNNNGRYFIGQEVLAFELCFYKSGDQDIQLLNDPVSINTVAVVKDKNDFSEIDDARIYDGSSRTRRPKINQIAILQNSNGFYAAIKILSIKDDTRGAEYDEVTFDYVIQTNGTPDFTALKR